MIGWNFPANNDGEEDGFHNAGIETFKGSPWVSLAREIIQNSLDAKHSDSDPVKVVFKLKHLQNSKFPGIEEFKEILQSCKNYWKDNSKTKKFFEQAYDIVSRSTIPVLKISDFNTTGLSGLDKEKGGDWYSLIKSSGNSDKNSQAGGSYGIGKNAPFACSRVRTIFYGTKEFSGKTAFQGVAKLVTHINKNGEKTRGTGYFGIKDRNRPIKKYSDIDEFFFRSEVGTDVFIAGFNDAEGWQSKIIKSVLENFFVALIEKRLTVLVGNTVIDDKSLEKLMNEYVKNDPNCFSDKYYNALISREKNEFCRKNFEELGRVCLYIVSGSEYPKKIAMVRSTGMKIFDKGHFRTPMKFAGVMIAEGKKLNKLLRSMEPPSHDDWQPERCEENSIYAEKIKKKLYQWINDCVRSISKTDDKDELDVEGISQYLPDDFDEVPLSMSEEIGEGEKGDPKEFVINEVVKYSFDEPASADENQETGEGGNINSRNKRKGNKDDDKDGNKGGNKDDDKEALNLKHVRIFCINAEDGTYSVSFQPDIDGEGLLNFYIVGEVGAEFAPIKKARFKNGKKINVMKRGRIGPIKFKSREKNTLLITLEENLRCAMEVTVDAD